MFSGQRSGHQQRYRAVLALGIVALLILGGGFSGARHAQAAPGPAGGGPYQVARADFSVDFGDFQTQAQITYPANAPGPFPTVVLIPGSGPYDRDFTITDRATGRVRSHIFLDIAESLTSRGYAVVRYNKHYITKPNDPQEAATFYRKFTLKLLLADAERVYAATQARPEVDPARVILYGWSEGTTIATQIAVAHPAIAGLVLHGPVAGAWVDTFRYQIADLVAAYLRDVVDTNKDGLVSAADIFGAYTRQPSTVGANTFALLFSFDQANPQATPKLNPAVDKNGDGQLDITHEVVPFFADYFANFEQINAQGPFEQYTLANALPTILATIPMYRRPVLLLQGDRDANVPPDGANALDAALATGGNTDHTLIRYPDLGHSLGSTASVYTDFFAPIASQPLRDLGDWLDARFATPPMPGLPNTGAGGMAGRSPYPRPLLLLGGPLLWFVCRLARHNRPRRVD